MAKLSAYGRTELCRMEKIKENGTKYTVVFMSDGSVLSKMSWKGYSGNWKKVKKYTTEGQKKAFDMYKNMGYNVIKGGM
jgi:hypothetical protein